MPGDLAIVAQIAVKSSVAVLFAALGELVAEKSGVLNLGVEGMMLVGALAGFAVGAQTQDPVLAAGAGMAAGGAMAMIHAAFTVGLGADQVVSGLSLTILGAGLSGFLGRPLVNASGPVFETLALPGLKDLPFLGPALFSQNVLVYLAFLLTPLIWFALLRTRLGLMIRASGEDAISADASGVPVRAIRFGCTVFGGLLAGLGGSYLSLAYTPGWKEGMTAGQGWIAIAMVVFSTWNPLLALAGALMFGWLTALQFYFQATGSELIPPSVLRMLPYVLTIAVLVLANRTGMLKGRAKAPANLGLPFSREP
ncbi:MAG: ABC transporter permease [Desulfovibrionaceae bacterium]|nr:ABC transporter permease [Desulfovibrionaceae bacterium]